MGQRPNISRRHKICIICEGYEDKAYMDRLIELNVWSDVYDFTLINAKTASSIPARFQDAFQNDQYEMILVFCDTDKYPHREYALVKQKINRFLNKRKASEKLIIYANPCTMQIILLHFEDVSLKNQGKKTNSEIIEKLTGIKDYDAHEDQIKELCGKIYRRSYQDMKARVIVINNSDEESGSTNFSIFLKRFEENDESWITKINKYLRDSGSED